MAQFIKKLKKTINEMGLPASLLYAMAKVLSRISSNNALHYYLFVRQETVEKPRLPPHRGKHFKFQLLTQYDKILDALPRPHEVIQNRFKHGYVCIAALKDEQFVGCIWLSLHSYLEDEVRATYTPQPSHEVAWDFDVYIAPEFRATYLFPKLWDEADNYLKSQGFKATASRISGFNIQSVNSHKKLGAETISRAVYIKIGGLQLSLCSSAPYVHLSCNEKSIPQYKLG